MLDPKSPRNDQADAASKSLRNGNPDNCSRIFYAGMKMTDSFIKQKWQRKWTNNENNNKLRKFKPVQGEWRLVSRKRKMVEEILTQLHIGHTNLIY